jgi:excisionase family DNA binding protein
MSEKSKWMTMDGAADEAGLSLRSIRREISSGRLPAYRVGGIKAVRILRSDLEKLFTPVVPNGKC